MVFRLNHIVFYFRGECFVFILKEQRKVIIEITIFICTTTMQAKYEYVYIKNDVEV